MNFDGLTTIHFAPKSGPGFVYVLCWVTADDKEIPFYVGQTKSSWQRLNDYYWADCQTSTDFKVGEAVKYLNERGYHVVAKYKPSMSPREEEKTIIDMLKAEGSNLLNDCAGYKYQTAKEADERVRIQRYVNALLLGPDCP